MLYLSVSILDGSSALRLTRATCHVLSACTVACTSSRRIRAPTLSLRTEAMRHALLEQQVLRNLSDLPNSSDPGREPTGNRMRRIWNSSIARLALQSDRKSPNVDAARQEQHGVSGGERCASALGHSSWIMHVLTHARHSDAGGSGLQGSALWEGCTESGPVLLSTAVWQCSSVGGDRSSKSDGHFRGASGVEKRTAACGASELCTVARTVWRAGQLLVDLGGPLLVLPRGAGRRRILRQAPPVHHHLHRKDVRVHSMAEAGGRSYNLGAQ